MYGSGLQPLRRALRASRARAVVWLVLAAFVLQFTATRAHFHFGPAHEGTVVVSADLGTPKAPLHNQANCWLFHAASVCGAALAGTAAVPIIPNAAATRAVFTPAVPEAERIAANWRSRAPPSL
jgi:hypothetical protein